MDQIADYTLVRSLGGGANGEYYLASPPARLGLVAEYVAVKVWASASTGTGFQRATRELRLFATVQSDQLVRLYDAGQEGATFFYAMEYYPLGSLATPARPLTRAEVLRSVADAARAAHALHEAGIVHRDIKPGNILLHEHGAKLSDLGLAQCISPGLTVTGMNGVGSIEYVDPAVLRSERPSRASDIWSIGVTLHRVLAGTGVFGELPESDPVLAVRTVLAHPTTISDDLGDDERALIERCLAPSPSDRPSTAAAVAEELDRIAARAEAVNGR
jgi:serine/threonine protein kinase